MHTLSVIAHFFDPHTITGTWATTLLVILLVIVSGLAARLLAPIRPAALPASDEATETTPPRSFAGALDCPDHSSHEEA